MGREGTNKVSSRVKFVTSSLNSALRRAVPTPVTCASGPAAVILEFIGLPFVKRDAFLHMWEVLELCDICRGQQYTKYTRAVVLCVYVKSTMRWGAPGRVKTSRRRENRTLQPLTIGQLLTYPTI